jgi:hypothetical protein
VHFQSSELTVTTAGVALGRAAEKLNPLSNGRNWPYALFAIGKQRYHVQNKQHDQNAECDVIGNCHGRGTLSFIMTGA